MKPADHRPAMPMQPYEEVPHTADWALRVRGAGPSELFVNAAEGMYALIGAETPAGAPEIRRDVTLAAPDLESLLVAWLNELLYFTEVEGLASHRFEIAALDGTQLQAAAWGAPAAGMQKQIKAVTFHDLKIVNTSGGLETTIVFDV
jgi:SHS2 domain-containing protein